MQTVAPFCHPAKPLARASSSPTSPGAPPVSVIVNVGERFLDRYIDEWRSAPRPVIACIAGAGGGGSAQWKGGLFADRGGSAASPRSSDLPGPASRAIPAGEEQGHRIGRPVRRRCGAGLPERRKSRRSPAVGVEPAECVGGGACSRRGRSSRRPFRSQTIRSAARRNRRARGPPAGSPEPTALPID